jgi:hypothetical protein
LNAGYFREIDRQLGERSRLVVLKRKGEIVAFSLCLLGDLEYFSAHAGFDYEQAEADNSTSGCRWRCWRTRRSGVVINAASPPTT